MYRHRQLRQVGEDHRIELYMLFNLLQPIGERITMNPQQQRRFARFGIIGNKAAQGIQQHFAGIMLKQLAYVIDKKIDHIAVFQHPEQAEHCHFAK